MDTEVKISQLLEIVPKKLKKLITSYWDLLDMMMYENYPFDFETFEKNAIARCGYVGGYIHLVFGLDMVFEAMDSDVIQRPPIPIDPTDDGEVTIVMYPLGDKMPFWKIKEGPNNG